MQQASPAIAASHAPTVLMVAPQANGVAINRYVAVVFSQAMDPATINTSTFLIAGVAGTVTYDAVNHIAAFKPLADFAPNTTYNGTITTGVTNTLGVAMEAPFTFSFITRLLADTSAPQIVAVNVVPGATCVPLDQTIRVTFNQPVDSFTVIPANFFIEGISGSVTYSAGTQTAILTPAGLAANTTYTIRVTTGIRDLAGVPLAAPLSQTFTTGPCAGGRVSPVPLCPFIGEFSVLAGSTVTNTGSTVVTGDVGVSPGSAVTGFPPGIATGTIHRANGAAAGGQAALLTAYLDAEGRAGASSVSGDLVGQTLVPGIYKSTSSLGVTGELTLDAQGDPDAVFIFQIASTLITGSGSLITLANEANACNVYWQVGSSATLGTNSDFSGNIMALTSISVTTGTEITGRALARNGAVTLDTNTIGGCTCPVP